MADITMCKGTCCPFKDKCYRHTAEPKESWQSWFTEPPIKDGKCDMYWGEQSEAIWNQLVSITQGKK